jgi:hypothetical protein
MLRLPPNNHPVRDLLDTDDIVALTTSAVNNLPSIPEARVIAKERLAKRKPTEPGMRAPQLGAAVPVVNMLAIDRDGRVLLVGFNAKNGFKIRWSFGRLDVIPERVKNPPPPPPEPAVDAVLDIPAFLRRGAD